MLQLNLYPTKILAGIIIGFLGIAIGNLLPLMIAVIVFEIIDFVTGCWKSAVVSKRKGEHFAFESVKAWRAIYKFVFILIGLFLAEILDATLCEERLRFANYFAAFVCGVEFWSFLENAAIISKHPIFRWLKQFMKTKVEDELHTDFDNIKKNE